MTDCRSLAKVFDSLFPHGPAAQEVIQELAPDGWMRSELVRVCHPTATQIRKAPSLSKLKTLGRPIRPESECAEVIGVCLRELFAVHDVIAPYPIELSTWRGTAADIADWLNRRLDVQQYDDLDFYMGPFYACQLADLTPVYSLILRRFKQKGLDLLYAYPQWYVAYTGGERADYLKYRTELEAINSETRREIDEGPPPDIVAAYVSVFGHPPKKSEE